MTTITRQQLRDAIEAGITAAREADRGLTPGHAEALRAVVGEATVVGRGAYVADDGNVLCPVALAFPASERGGLVWASDFARRYDDATWAMIESRTSEWSDGWTLHITDDSTEGGAA